MVDERKMAVDAAGGLFGSLGDICHLSLVLPQVWLWILLRAIDQSAAAHNLAFYVAEGISLVAMLLLFRAAPPARATSRAVSWAAALLMAVAPIATLHGASLGGAPIAMAGVVVGGVALMWAYADYFLLCARIELRKAVFYLLLSFAVVPVVRLPLDMLPVEGAVLFAAPLPFVYVLANRMAAGTAEDDAGGEVDKGRERPSRAEGAIGSRDRLLRVIVELVAFGFAMGFLRFDAEGIHDSAAFVFINFAVKVLVPLVVLMLVASRWQRVNIGWLCQVALVALLVLMVVAANFPGVPGVAFAVFDICRYIIVVLLFLALTALSHRSALHPYALFAAGMGSYTIALATGLAVANVLRLGSFGDYPSALVLDVVCLLAVVTVLATSVEPSSDLRLFADGDPVEAPVQTADEIDMRCARLAASHSLTKRELETMQLICRGRSKRYIAEHMGLSENTVRGYAKTLYVKLGIHSREELLDLLDLD